MTRVRLLGVSLDVLDAAISMLVAMGAALPAPHEREDVDGDGSRYATYIVARRDPDIVDSILARRFGRSVVRI